MENKKWRRRVLRGLLNFTPLIFLSEKLSWRWLRFYPAVIPASNYFEEWNRVDNSDIWQEYQAWIEKNSINRFDEWRELRLRACRLKSPPKISIVTPVFNTQNYVLLECINSVRVQSYPFWQLILVDDQSSRAETHNLLKSAHCKDPRIQVYYCQQSQGISKATNLGIEKSQGDFVIFLDHDDRLALDALFQVAEKIQQFPDVDIIYSDRDMISPEGRRYMHLFKPDWSPETLLAGNYIFHLMCYRRSLLERLGGYRPEFDGSQDYDLILRAAETQPKVQHIKKVLYHWRQSQDSVSLDSGAKDYAFDAGVSALNEALQRRNIAGKATEITDLWRGNYQLDLICQDLQEIEVIMIDPEKANNGYTQLTNKSIQTTVSDRPFIALISQELTTVSENAITLLTAWLKMEGVGLASGGIITNDNLIEYVGASYTKEGELISPYHGFPVSEVGYMAVSKLARNISAPHPLCVLIRREVWQQLSGFNDNYEGFYALLDFSLRALDKKWRCVSVPQAQFVSSHANLLANYSEQDKHLFCEHWQSWLEAGDPYYNNNLDRTAQERMFHINKA